MSEPRESNTDRSFYRLREYNEWEGETWFFYVPLTGEEYQHLKDLISGADNYSLSDKPIDESKIDTLVSHSAGGYMAYHNKCKPVSLPDLIDWAEEDPFYKGGIRDMQIGGETKGTAS